MKTFAAQVFAVFLILCVAFIPLDFGWKSLQFEISNFLFHDIIQIIQNNFFENAFKTIDFSSDTIALNLLISLLYFLAIILILFCRILKVKISKLDLFSRTIIIYYLAYILLKYGFDKIFKAQFYLPEPNILYSQFGDLSRDILYWSTIGTSRFYSVSLGIIEVFTAVLLLINRTRILGLLLAIAVFINVILINFGFDISVKTFSCLLLLMVLFTIYPELKIIFQFLIQKQLVQIPSNKLTLKKQKAIKNGFKTFAIGLMLIQIIIPYQESNNFNDDAVSRPFLHGAYLVTATNQKKSNFMINRFYIHRKNYLILENKSGQKIDYFFELDENKNEIKLIDYHSKIIKMTYEYSNKDSILQINFPNFKLISKAQNWRKMKVLHPDFHYTLDEI